MKKRSIVYMVAAALILSLTACGDSEAGGTSQPSQPGESLAASAPESDPQPDKEEAAEKEGEEAYEISYTSVKTYTNSIGTTYAQVIVEIENTGTADLYLSSGSYDLEDANGKLITSNSLVSTYPEVISPGEKAYMYEEDMLDEAVEGELTVLPRPSVKKAKISNIRYSVTDVEINSDQYGFLKATGRVENTTAEDEDGMVYVVLILKDANGTPIGQMFTIITEDFAAGSKIGFEASGISLPDSVTADAIASYDVFAYPMQMQF